MSIPLARERLSAVIGVALAASAAAERWRRSVWVVVALLNIAVVVVSLGVWTRHGEIDPGRIRAEAGQAYVVEVPGRPPFPLGAGGDSSSRPTVSSLVLTQDGVALGPAHALHADIRAHGGGAYSAWGNALYFSTPDGSDPRSNGRIYRVTYQVAFEPMGVVAIWFLSALALAATRRPLAAGLLRHGDKGLIAILLLAIVLLLAVAAKFVPVLNSGAGPPKDWHLIEAIVLHAAIGAVLAAAVAATSIAAAIAVLRRRSVDPWEAVLVGFPVALPTMVALAAAAVFAPQWRWGAALIFVLTWSPLLAWRPNPAALSEMLRLAARCIAPAAAFASFMALLWHGPTATLPASTLGDLLHSYASVHMLVAHPHPLWHLASEGDVLPYENMAPMVVAAALFSLPGFDGMLFLTASLAMFFALWLGLGLAAVGRSFALERPRLEAPTLAVLVALVLAATRTPSFVVESPPVAFMLPLLFSVSYLAKRAAGATVPSVLVGLGAIVGTALSKVVLLVPLAPLALTDMALRMKAKRPAPWQMALLVIATAAAGAYVFRALSIWGPVYLSTFVPGPDTRIWFFDYGSRDPVILAAVLARDLGWCVLGYGVFRMGIARLTLGYWAGIGANFVYPYLFHPAAIFSVLLVPIAVLMEPGSFSRARGPLTLAAVLLLPYPLTRDWSGSQAAIVWVACIAPIAWMAMGNAQGELARWSARRVVPAFATVLLLGLVAIGSGLLVVDSGWRQGQADVLTPAMYDIWTEVRRMTPPNALIFTDLTGPEFRVTSGWDSYAASGERQVFIASWVTSFRRFRIDPQARAERLAENDRVLAGELDPAAVRVSRAYDGYFAVMRNSHQAPRSFERMYRNTELTLYRVPAWR